MDRLTPHHREAVLFGRGSHTYELVSGWGVLPEGVRWGYTHGVAIDSQRRIIIHNRSKDAVVFLDPEGRFMKSWGSEFEKGAHGLCLHREGKEEFLYLADPARHLVVKATLDGEIVWTLGYPQEAGIYEHPDQYKPTNIAVAPNGDFYVADGYGLFWIHQYSANAEYVRSWGGKGSEAGKLNEPHGIWADTRKDVPELIVADRKNQRLQTFTLDGRSTGFVFEELLFPCHFYQQGNELYVPDLWGRVTILDGENRLITHLGDYPDIWKHPDFPNIPVAERYPDRFIAPHSVCLDDEGNLYVVEFVADGRVSKLRRLR